MFPWNQNLWLYASANSYKPGTSTLYTHHRSGYVDFVNRVPKADTSSSSNPLLIVQKTSDTPAAATERYEITLKRLQLCIYNFFKGPFILQLSKEEVQEKKK